MNILFITHFFSPHIGGVETHLKNVAEELVKKGHKVTVLTEKHSKDLKNWEIIKGVKIVRFSYPHIKFLGLLFIWFAIFKQRKLIKASDVVHIHDVFIWYLPFVVFLTKQKIFTTFHGWEGKWPIPKINIKLKRLAQKYSDGTIAIGKYIEKYYGIKTDKIMYGGSVTSLYNNVTNKQKIKGSVVFVGRLEKDTGLLKFLKRLDDFEYRNLQFIGDGSLWNLCQKYGRVHGFTDAKEFLRSAEYVVPGGYLSYIEALDFGCKPIIYWDTPIKEDYWKDILKVKRFPTWSQIANEYLDLWTGIGH